MEETMETFNTEMQRVPTCIELLGHDTDSNILKSQMLLWENTGRGEFSDLDNVIFNKSNGEERDTMKKAYCKTEKEIRREILSEEDSARIIKEFNAKMSNKSKLLSCGSCGERKYNAVYKEVNVEVQLQILKLSNSQINEWSNLNEYKDVASVSNVNDELYNIHPECLTVRDGHYYTNLCTVCNLDIKNNEIPKFSIANGHDYGDPSRLKDLLPLSVVEMHLISRNRMYASIIKLKEGSNRQLLGNVIIFEQDGPEKCSKIFDYPDFMNVRNSLRVAFVGSKKQYEINRKDVIMTCGELNVRTKNVYNWLRMLKQCNPKYWNITINESDECKLLLNNLTKE